MKWLFYLAVLLNIGYLGYNLSYNNTLILPDKKQHHASEHSIVLLAEIKKTQAEQKATSKPVQTGNKDNATDILTTDKVSKQVTANNTEKATKIESEQNKPVVTSIEIITQQDVLEPQTPLLSNESGQVDYSNNSQPQDSQEPAVQKDSVICFKLGPFKKANLDKIKLELEQLYASRISFGIETTSKITYYRIYIPPLKTRELRKEALAHLDKNGMTDHYVMSIDGRKNAIALGVFKKREAAEKVAARANKLGFSTTIEAISDDKNSLYNLQLVIQANEDLDPLNKLINQKRLKLMQCDK